MEGWKPVSSSVRREVFALAWPALLHSLLHTLVFIVDRAMLGHYGTVEISSFQVAGPLVWSSSMIFGSFVVGTVAVVARSWGEGDRVRAERTVAVSLSMAAVLGSVLGALLALGAPFAVGLFGLPAQAAGAAITYLRVVASFFPFLFVYLISFWLTHNISQVLWHCSLDFIVNIS